MAKKKKTATSKKKSAPKKRKATEGAAIALLKADHRKVEKLFRQFEKLEETGEKADLVRQICLELIVHTKLEEEIFYPACREADVEDDLLDEAQVEHDGAKVLIGDLLQGSAEDEFYDAKVTTLSEYIKHHVGEEEQPGKGIFAKAKKAGLELDELGRQIKTRKAELLEKPEALLATPPQPVSIQLSSGKRRQSGSVSEIGNGSDAARHG